MQACRRRVRGVMSCCICCGHCGTPRACPAAGAPHDQPVTFLVFILGAALGSFLNVVIYRLPRGESLVRPRSRCPHCGTAIAAYDNIPVLSYLILRGRCRNCGQPISPRYPIVELTAGLLLTAAWTTSATWLQFVSGGLLVLMLVAIA